MSAFMSAFRLSAQGHSERGASAVEYGLLVAGIATVMIASVIALGGTVNGLFTTAINALGG